MVRNRGAGQVPDGRAPNAYDAFRLPVDAGHDHGLTHLQDDSPLFHWTSLADPAGPDDMDRLEAGLAKEAIEALDLTEEVDLHGSALASLVSSGVAPQPTASAGGAVLGSWASGRAAGLYNVKIEFQGSWTAPLQHSFTRAAGIIESIVRSDLPNVAVWTGSGLKVIDDIVISASLQTIDGAGGILGQAGPTAIRTATLLPAMARMSFDLADAKALAAKSVSMTVGGKTSTETLWDAVVVHEMLHALGLGSLWSAKGLVSGGKYLGAAAGLEYAHMLNPAATKPVAVPLETSGGAGTRDAHWSEAVFKTELMTGYLNQAYAPVSALTAYSLADLGYGLDAAANWKTDAFHL